jgi:DnaJ-domain-containing protein 1
MNRIVYYFLLVLLALYILSPLDLHPLFLDDLIATAVLFYLWYTRLKPGKQRRYTSSRQSHRQQTYSSQDTLSLDEAYRLLAVQPDASLTEIKKAYKEKVSKSHPDKVSHLSEELQEKAKELTHKLNTALEIIKKNKKN